MQMTTRTAAVLALCWAVPYGAVVQAQTPLSSDGLGGLVVDDRRGHVFVTQRSTTVEVFDLDGNPVASIGGQSGAGAMFLDRSRLYVAQRTAGAIAEIDTRTLREKRRFRLGLGGACVESLGVTRHLLWFGFSCQGSDCPCTPALLGGIGSTRRRGGSVSTYRGPSGYPYYRPMLVADRRLRNSFVAADAGLSPARLRRYVVPKSGAPVEVAQTPHVPNIGSNLQDIVLAPLSQDVLVACGAPYHVTSLALDDLAFGETYDTGPYPTAVAVTRDGRYVAAGRNAHYEPDVYVFPIGSATPVNVFELAHLSPESPDLIERGLAFDAKATRLYAVTGGFFGGPSVLHVIRDPLVPTTTTTSTSTTSSSTTTSTSPYACGGAFPSCGGSCTAGETCVATVVGGLGLCECAPEPACGDTGGVCGGGCPPGRSCVLIHISTCGCSD